FQVHVQLTECDDDPASAELLIDTSVYLIDNRIAVTKIPHMQAKLVLQPALAEVEEEDLRFRLLEHAGVLPGCLEKEISHFFQLGAELHADANRDPGDGVIERPVDELVGHERLVRDDDLLVVEIGNGRRPNANAADCSRQIANGYH